MASFQPEDRELFEAEAAQLYDDIVDAGSLNADDPRLSADSPQRKAFDLLVELGLVQLDPTQSAWRAIEPTAAQSRVVTPLGTEGARLIEESARWTKAFQSVTQSWRKAPADTDTGGVLYLHMHAISPYLTALIDEASEELLTAQPQAGRDPKVLAEAFKRDSAALERGVSMRTLYQHSARRNAATHDYVANITAAGGEVRTLDEFFNRMIVIDRKVAVIPSAGGVQTAVVVREPALVAYLVDVFDRAFQRGRPFTSSDQAVVKAIAGEQRAMTIRMLIEGHSDSVSAKRLGVSPRTYAGYVADLKQEFETDTRFQLGYVMGQLGLAGDEADPRDAVDRAEKNEG